MKLALALVLFALPVASWAQSEGCDRFSFAVSQTKLAEVPITVLRGGLSPVLEIAGKPYAYDVTTHCLNEASQLESSKQTRDCSKPLKVMDGKKVVALIEGQGKVSISPVDAKGKKDALAPHYSVFVARDVSSPARPRFVMEAVSAEGHVFGRIDGIEGMTSKELTHFKGRLASAHNLIDLRGKSLVWANCRKLAVAHYEDSHAGMMRMVASARAQTVSRQKYSPLTANPNRAMASSIRTRTFNVPRTSPPSAPSPANYGTFESASIAPPPSPVYDAPPPAMEIPTSYPPNFDSSAPPPPSSGAIDPMNPMKQ